MFIPKNKLFCIKNYTINIQNRLHLGFHVVQNKKLHFSMHNLRNVTTLYIYNYSI
ncbi:uncharacterized protein DS421_4g108180 [Arachis hypogaea]|nr:uncharacterized protein DS421_4g108180 [Arachis hypogaea]